MLCIDNKVCNPTPTMIPGVLATDITASTDFACAITINGKTTGVTCWGNATQGQLGVIDGGSGGPTTILFPKTITPISISAKYPGEDVCVIDSNHFLWCWGDNTWGQVGHTPGTLGDVQWATYRYGAFAPVEVTNAPDGGGGFVDQVLTVNASATTCAVRGDAGTSTNGTLYCWGDNANGGLANGTADPADAGYIPHPQPTSVAGLSNVVAVNGGHSTCALIQDGTVMCWGPIAAVNGRVGSATCEEVFGGTITTDCEVTPVQVNGVAALILTTDALSAVALDRDAGIVAWGFNGNGELGHDSGTSGDFFDGGAWQNFVPLPVMGLP
jgi:alpha-tubulin suppressor-like RCC1 family protein